MNDEAKARMEAVKAFYGENHWWESKDLRTLGYYQVFEPVLLIPFQLFHAALEHLLQRPVWTHEMGLNIEGLRREAEAEWQGKPYSAEQKSVAIQYGLHLLQETAGDRMIIMLADDAQDDD